MSTFIGRQTTIERIETLLGEGQHVSVVAPKSMGKTRVLQTVVARANTGGGPFVSAGLVDFRHNPPTSMAGALARVGETLKTAYAAAPDLGFLANEIDTSATTEELYDQLKIAVDMVAEMSQRVLLVLDGCDAVLQNATIPRNLWDNLRALAQSSSLRLMTGTRDQLVNLCYNPDARTSDFFRIFWDEPIRVGPFDDADLDDVYQLEGRAWDGAARKELANWTGGRPDLIELMLDHLGRASVTTVGKTEVDNAGEDLVAQGSARLSSIWLDCSDESRGDVLQLLSSDVAVAEMPVDRLRYLVERGIAVQSGNKVRLRNRLIEQIAGLRQVDVTGVRRLFESQDQFRDNIKSVLELRLAQLDGVDARLKRFVARAVRHLPEDPDGALGSARDILDRALDIIWEAECPNGHVPEEWIDAWNYTRFANMASEYKRAPDIPEERGRQCALLRVATGQQRVSPVAKKVTKSTHVLIEHMNQLGDLKNHSKDEPTITLAVAFCFSGIELLESLKRELSSVQSSRQDVDVYPV